MTLPELHQPLFVDKYEKAVTHGMLVGQGTKHPEAAQYLHHPNKPLCPDVQIFNRGLASRPLRELVTAIATMFVMTPFVLFVGVPEPPRAVYQPGGRVSAHPDAQGPGSSPGGLPCERHTVHGGVEPLARVLHGTTGQGAVCAGMFNVCSSMGVPFLSSKFLS